MTFSNNHTANSLPQKHNHFVLSHQRFTHASTYALPTMQKC